MTSQPDSPASSSSPWPANEGLLPPKKVQPLQLPTVEKMRWQDIWNNCAVRGVVSGVIGGGFGLINGLIFASLDDPITHNGMSGKERFIYTAKQMGRKSISSARKLGIMGLIFSATECAVTKARAKHGMTNTVVAGCVTGAALAAKGGPQTACIGCAGFATFAAFMEKCCCFTREKFGFP